MTKRFVYAVFGSKGFMDSQEGPLLAIFSSKKAADRYANRMMGFVEKIEVRKEVEWD